MWDGTTHKDSRMEWLISLLAFAVVGTARASAYAVVVDAGSTGSKLYVYRWNPTDWTNTSLPKIETQFDVKIKPGLSSFGDNLDHVKGHLTQLLNYAKMHVPEQMQKYTPLLFMATGGLRLLDRNESALLMEKAEQILKDSSVDPLWYNPDLVRVLTGGKEGSFAWLDINYLLGVFIKTGTKKKTPTVGVLEMGGASSQITFLPEVDPLADMLPVQVQGETYNLYSHSYLDYAQNSLDSWIAENLVRKHPFFKTVPSPCMLKGHNQIKKLENGVEVEFQGSGDTKKCEELIDQYMDRIPPACCTPGLCGLEAADRPPVPEGMQLYGVAVFYFIAEQLHMLKIGDTKVRPVDFRTQGLKWCKKLYTEAVKEKGEDPLISSYCSSSLLIYKLLTKVFHLSETASNLHVIMRIHGEDQTWTRGALINFVEKLKQNFI